MSEENPSSVKLEIEYNPDSGSYGASIDGLPVVGVGKRADEAIARFENARSDYFAFLHEFNPTEKTEQELLRRQAEIVENLQREHGRISEQDLAEAEAQWPSDKESSPKAISEIKRRTKN